MREIFFVKYYDKSSTVLGADQLSAALEERGVASRSVYPRDLAGVRNAVLVFVKTSKWHDLARARARGNKTVLDVQDTVVFKRWIKNRFLYDGIIFKNQRQLRDFGDRRRLCRVIYHQWDPRYTPNAVGERELRIGYFGDVRSFAMLPRLPGVDHVGADFFRRAPDYNCHVSVREDAREFLYKPNCKVSTAAACAANLITTPDVTTRELLGEDYPFYTTPDPASVTAAVERARAALGGPVWREGLERMRKVRERTRIDRIVDEYLRYFAELL